MLSGLFYRTIDDAQITSGPRGFQAPAISLAPTSVPVLFLRDQPDDQATVRKRADASNFWFSCPHQFCYDARAVPEHDETGES
jgi:hypothetical protein